MTRGDQRERDRAKNLKKQQQEKKGTLLPEGMTVAQKKELYLHRLLGFSHSHFLCF